VNVIDDAQSAYDSWREAPPGSYIERALADSIVRDLVPAMLVELGNKNPVKAKIGFHLEVESTPEGDL
jgi:hypothetical protein